MGAFAVFCGDGGLCRGAGKLCGLEMEGKVGEMRSAKA